MRQLRALSCVDVTRQDLKSKNMLRGRKDNNKASGEPKEARMSFVSMWDQLVDCICRPPRYSLRGLLHAIQA